ncbi:MAG: alpha-amylase family glycosyl hydrolase, partial [Polyangiales bacterium]
MTHDVSETRSPEQKVRRLIERDPLLGPYAGILSRRIHQADAMRNRLTSGHLDLTDFASGHEYFGLHFRDGRWVLREWAPNAESIHLKGPFSGWHAQPKYALFRSGTEGVWENQLPEDVLRHGDCYRLEVRWPWGSGDRLPAWTRRVVRDESTGSFNAQAWRPATPYAWHHERSARQTGPLLVYEAHVGMAQEEPKVGTYDEFRVRVLPRIRDAGYGAIQIMALAEHPYYASFGYQVSSFFACSSRFGTPEELKALVDEAHGMGLLVFMDLVHSHAARNEVEGISRQDGSSSLYFHEGPRGEHPAWNSRCFDYGKPQV